MGIDNRSTVMINRYSGPTILSCQIQDFPLMSDLPSHVLTLLLIAVSTLAENVVGSGYQAHFGFPTATCTPLDAYFSILARVRWKKRNPPKMIWWLFLLMLIMNFINYNFHVDRITCCRNVNSSCRLFLFVKKKEDTSSPHVDHNSTGGDRVAFHH